MGKVVRALLSRPGFGRGASLRRATLLGVLTCMVVPGVASASVARLDFSGDARVEYLANPGETNVVTIGLSGGTYTVNDSAGVTAGSGCAQVTATQVTCPSAGVRRVTARGEDLNDNITVSAASPSGSFIHGGLGNDILRGGARSDNIQGSDGVDRLIGEGGDDMLTGGLGNDQIDGGSGSDTISFADRTNPVRIDLSFKLGGLSGGEIGTTEKDGIQATVENAIGGRGNDEVVGGEGYNILSGGAAGADVICGGLGVDTVDYSDRTTPVRVSLDGSMPTDPRIVGAMPAREDCRDAPGTQAIPTLPGQGPRDCVANDGEDTNGDGAADEGDCVGEDIENILGGEAGDTLVGNDPDLLIATAPRVEPRGRNVLTGGPGNDVLDGRFGPDVFEGGSGVDTVTYAGRIAPVNATIDGAADDGDAVGPIGGDLEPGDGRRDNILTDVENVEGGSGSDVLRGSPAANRVDGGPGDDMIFGGDGAAADDTLIGGSGNDIVHGQDGDDLLQGSDGDDVLDGGPGADQLLGEAGNDRLGGRSGPDWIGGGDGSDAADYAEATFAVSVTPNGSPDDGIAGEMDNVDTDVEGALGGSDSDVLMGNGGGGFFDGGDGDDRITPGDGGGPDVVRGGRGFDSVSYAGRGAPLSINLTVDGGDGQAGENDHVSPDVEQVTGGEGDDDITGTADANTLIGGGGKDRLNGGDGVDRLEGGAGDDTLLAGTGDDLLFGIDGNDSLDGGPGADSLDGGAGDDQAAYSSRREALIVTLDGEPDDGARGENDRIKTNVEGIAAGAGADRLNSRDGVAGDVSCGGGRDTLDADSNDRIDVDCEEVNGRAFGVCTASSRGIRTTRSRVRLRVSCSFRSRGSVRLTTARSVRVGGRKRKVRLGSRSFTARAGRPRTVSVRVSRLGRRALARNSRLRTRVTVIARPRGTGAQSASRKRTSRVVVLRVTKRSGKR